MAKVYNYVMLIIYRAIVELMIISECFMDSLIFILFSNKFQFILSCFVKGYSLLHWSACWGYIDIIKYLCRDMIVDISQKNIYGETAKQMALRYNKDSCALLLDKYGKNLYLFKISGNVFDDFNKALLILYP